MPADDPPERKRLTRATGATSEVSRRVLLTAAAAVAGAGVIDAVQTTARGSTPVNRVARRAATTRDGNAHSIRALLAPATQPAPIPHPFRELQAAERQARVRQRARRRAHQAVERRREAAHDKHGRRADPRHHHDHHLPTSAKHGRQPRRLTVEHVDLPSPRIRLQQQPAYYLADVVPDAPHRTLALTIDDGPDPDWTPTVLRLLDKHRMRATFCIVGVHVATYPRLVRDIARAGHAIVNHSYSHPLNFADLTEKRIVHEITANQQLIERTAKVTPQLFRSPGGDWSRFVYRALAAYDLLPLEWDVDPEDWKLPGRRVIQRRMLRARPNDIVLCHDGGGDRAETVRALRRVLPKWKHAGYDVLPLHVPDARWRRLQL